MRKLIAVLRREYLMAVRKKMFIIMTFLLPFLMAGLITLPGLMIKRGMGEKRIAVLDGTGLLGPAFAKHSTNPDDFRSLPTDVTVNYVSRKGDANLQSAAKPYLDSMAAKRLDGVLLIPAAALDGTNAQIRYYSRSATDFITRERLASIANKALQRQRLAENGIAADALKRLLRDVPIDSVQIMKSGEQKKGGESNFFIGFAFAALLILPSFVYGLDLMRGIIQEKSDRIVEILISSMSPMQLLSGKILGIALVGLTQVGAWIVMGLLVASFAATTAALAGINIAQFLHPVMFVYFLIFFVLAYCTYVCVYAIGGAVCNTEREAQQLIAPISMIMMTPWFLMAPIIFNPDSPMAVGFSLAPVFGPITMFIRTLVSDPPLWHILVSILVSVATIALFFRITAKIFRVGILSYGKRPTLAELWQWLKIA